MCKECGEILEKSRHKNFVRCNNTDCDNTFLIKKDGPHNKQHQRAVRNYTQTEHFTEH